MFDDAGALLPVLVGAGNGRANGDPHYHTFDGDTIHFQGKPYNRRIKNHLSALTIKKFFMNTFKLSVDFFL